MTTDDIRFTDVDEALRDKQRLAWLLPVIDGSGKREVGEQRTAALADVFRGGLRGIPLVDAAMARCPA